MANNTMLRTNLVFFSLTCGSLAVGMFLTRNKDTPYIGQKAASLPPFLTIKNQHLWSSQHVFLNSNGVKVMLIPTLPVAEKMFYHDVARELQLSNAVALHEGSPALNLVPAGSNEKKDSADDPLADTSSSGVTMTFGDKFDSDKGSSTEFTDYSNTSRDSLSQASPFEKKLSGASVTTQGYFVDLLGKISPDRIIKVDVATPTPLSGSIFRYSPLPPENKDVIMLAVETQEKRLLGREWDDFVQSKEKKSSPPQAIAILWNAGGCPAIAAALKERSYVQTNQVDRVLLTRTNFKNAFGRGIFTARDAASVATVASKAVVM